MVRRITVAMAPADAAFVAAQAGAAAAVTTVDNVELFQAGTMTGTVIDTRLGTDVPGIRLGTDVEFANAFDLTTTPRIQTVAREATLMAPWEGEGLQVFGGEEGAGFSSSDLMLLADEVTGRSTAVLRAGRIFLVPDIGTPELYLGNEVDHRHPGRPGPPTSRPTPTSRWGMGPWWLGSC